MNSIGKRYTKKPSLFTYDEKHGRSMAPRRTYIKHEKERQEFLAQLKNRCLPNVWKIIETTDNNLNNQLDKYNKMNTVQLIDKLNELNDQLGELKVNGGGQKGGMIEMEPLALIMSIANMSEQALEGASDIMYKFLNVFEYAMVLMTNKGGCLQDYLNMVLGNTLTQLFQGTLFIQILMHAPAMLPQLFAQLINLIGTISPYLLGSGSFLAQGIIGSIALTMVKYYISIADQGLKEAGDQAGNLSTALKEVIDMPAEQVIENTAQAIELTKEATKEAIQYIQSNQEKMKAAINNKNVETQQKITTSLRLGIIETLMRKLENEKADLIKEGSGDGTEFNELEKQYGDLMEERDSLKEKLNNGKEEDNNGKEEAGNTNEGQLTAQQHEQAEQQAVTTATATAGVKRPAAEEADDMDDEQQSTKTQKKEGGGTRKKRTSRKGKKKASKNRKTKARRARKSRKTKK